MGCLKIHLLGPFSANLDEQKITQFDTEKTRAILAYLASESHRPHQREILAEMFWPERPKGAARANLRHVLGNLRMIIGDRPSLTGAANPSPFLLASRDTIQLNQASSIWVDTAAFSELVNGQAGATGLRIDQLVQAVDLYRGPFLEDMVVGESTAFQEWVLLKREILFQEMVSALRQLINCYHLWGKYDIAIRYARRQMELAPWQEEAHQNVMRLLALNGQRSAALAQYETCRHFLREELGVEPGVETIQLYQQIRDGSLESTDLLPVLVGEAEITPRLPEFMDVGSETLEPPPIVAREHELASLEDFLQQALSGHGSVVFVTGVAGQGKTALLNAFARCSIMTHDGLLVAVGNCSLFSGVGDPYLPFRGILAMLTGDVDSQWSSGTISHKHAQRIWRALPNTIQTLLNHGDSLIGTFLDGKELFLRATAALPGHPQCLQQLRALIELRSSAANSVEQNFLFEHYANFLFSLSEQCPLVLLIDDLQWSDSASIGLLFHLGQRLAKTNHRILIVCAYRPEEVALVRNGERHPLVKVLNEFKRIFGNEWVDLDHTEQYEDRRFVEMLLDTECNQMGEEFRSALFQRTQGHPLFTVELLRAMQDRGAVFKNEDGDWIEAPTLDWELLPTRVQAVIEERIDRLSPELRQILNIASVEGEVFTAQIVAEVHNMAEKSLQSQLVRELERRHRLIREQGEQKTDWGRLSRYRFNHILFQDYLYKQLSQGERRLLHREVAAVMEKIYQGQLDEMSVQLAHHFYQSGENERAFEYSIRAARRAAHLYACDETVQHATRAIQIASKIAANKVTLINLYRERGLAYETLGKFQQALTDLETSARIAHAENESGLECNALIDLGKLWTSRDYTQSQRYFEQSLKLAREIENPPMLANSLNWMGNWHANAEQPKDAIRYHHEALEILKETGNPPELAKTLDLLGIASILAADCPTGRAYFDQAIDLFRELDDRASLASSLSGRTNIGGASYIYATISPEYQPGEARRDCQEALQIAHEIGSPADEAWADWSLGLVDIVQGNFGHALEIIRSGMRIATDMGHREMLVGNQAALGVLYVELFDLEEAQQQLEQALHLAEELRSQHWTNQTAGTLSTVYLLQNKLSQAENTLQKVLSPQTPMDSLMKRSCWLRRGELALAQDNPDLALEITDRLIRSAPGTSPGQVIPSLWQLKGAALAAMGQLEEAHALLCAALEKARENDQQFLLWRIHASLGKLYASMHCPTRAAQERSTARAMIESLAATIKEEHLKQQFIVNACKTL